MEFEPSTVPTLRTLEGDLNAVSRPPSHRRRMRLRVPWCFAAPWRNAGRGWGLRVEGGYVVCVCVALRLRRMRLRGLAVEGDAG